MGNLVNARDDSLLSYDRANISEKTKSKYANRLN